MKKRIISFVLALIMVVSIAPPLAFAADNTDELETTSVIDKIIILVASVERAKESWGFGEVDFSNLYIGNPVFAYEYVDDSLEENSKLYPISADGKLLFWAVVADDMVTISTGLVEQISIQIGLEEAFCVIYDKYGCYAYTGNSCILLSAYGDEDVFEARSIFSPKVVYSTKEIMFTSLADKRQLDYKSGIMPSSPNYYYSINIPAVDQYSDDNICWAACAACIVNYLTGTQLTAKDVAMRYYGYDYNKTANSYEVEVMLKKYYDIDYLSYRVVISDYVIYRNLLDHYPIYISWERVDGKKPGHACVLYGIDTYSGTISIMNPKGAYFQTAEAADGTYVFRSITSGTLFRMYGVVYHGTYY